VKKQTLRVDQIALMCWLRTAAQHYDDSANAIREHAADSASVGRLMRDNESDRDRCNAMADAIDAGASLSIDGDLLLVKSNC
jgi:hypothetical protein